MFSLRLFVVSVALACALAFVPSMRVRSPMGTSIDMAVKKEVVGKADLVSILKDKTGVSKKDCEAVLGALSETVKEEVLGSAKEIRLRDFGTFKQKTSKARMGRNPRTGEELQIKGSKSVGFSVAAAMKVKNQA